MLSDWSIDMPPPDEDKSNPNSRRNYGNRVLGPWVFGIFQNRKNVRFFVVSDRKASTLLPIIQQHVEPGSVIHFDEWKAYECLKSHGYLRTSV